jgi:imidazolonepropionase-like amidohydrolase
VTVACVRNGLKDLEAGWTTVRDAACRHFADIAVRDAINRGELVGPRIWACGLGITSTAGHMDREKDLAPHVSLPGPHAVADDPTEGRKAVRLNLRNNVDFIKINATLTEHVRRYFGYCAPEMTRDTMAAIFEEAHWHGRRVTAHCYGGPGATWAIEEGIDGIEHGFYLSDEHLDMMAARGTVLCPTLSVVGRFREHGDAALPPGNPHLPVWREKAIANAWKTVGRARERGVKIICGTDAAMPFVRHGTNAYELEMLVEAGLTTMDAVVSATSGAAAALDFNDVGTIAAGKFADLVFVDGDPLADITILQDLARVPLVIKGGHVVADRRPVGTRTPVPA